MLTIIHVYILIVVQFHYVQNWTSSERFFLYHVDLYIFPTPRMWSGPDICSGPYSNVILTKVNNVFVVWILIMSAFK